MYVYVLLENGDLHRFCFGVILVKDAPRHLGAPAILPTGCVPPLMVSS
jgi:hypothetical protein